MLRSIEDLSQVLYASVGFEGAAPEQGNQR
jgi:hypothetical protein